LGKRVIRKGGSVKIKSDKVAEPRYTAPYDLIRKMRASFLVSGPLLARYGKAMVSLPGGCAIGVRPVNIHVEGFKQLGAEIKLKKGNLAISCRRLTGSSIRLPSPSVGATENLMMAASLASGDTIISNVAREPEIIDLANFLNKSGAKISGAGTSTVKISGVNELSGTVHRVIPDRIETGTYLIAGAITGSSILIEDCIPEHLGAVISKLKQAGIKIDRSKNSIMLRSTNRLKPVNIAAEPYPGFPTDLQAQWMTLMCTANGKSVVKENVFENRFLHVAELQRLGGKLAIKGDHVVIKGNSVFSGAPVMVSDLRAGAALVLAGLVAAGRTIIQRVYHLDRGYEKMETKLRKLGAEIVRSS
jgi:UDP-N-acetylglucosamine 1-carboxyvinyltransferase